MSPESGLVENIFLGIFLFGLIFTVVSLFLGVTHVGAVGGHHADVHIGGADHTGVMGHMAHGSHAEIGHNGSHDSGLDGLSVLNMPTIMAFLTWFGGAGYIVTRTIGLGPIAAVPLALMSGLTGGTIMFLLLARVLWPMRSRPMSSEEYSLPGTPARVVSSIREGGVGEIVYSKAGSRFTAGARSEANQPIPKGTEVVIVRYEHGLAYVEPVDDLLSQNRDWD